MSASHAGGYAYARASARGVLVGLLLSVVLVTPFAISAADPGEGQPTTPPTASQPTNAPTSQPTSQPEPAGTPEPTVVATSTPSPSSQPTETADPTDAPVSSPTPQPTDTPTPAPSVTYLVTFATADAFAGRAALFAATGATQTEAIAPLRMAVVEVPQAGASLAATALRGAPGVTAVELGRERTIEATPDDSLFAEQWALPHIGWTDVYGGVAPAGNAVVAILDTGIDGSHPDLTGLLVPGAAFTGDAAPDTDANGHGTQMAGIVAAHVNNATGVAGVAFAGVQLMPVTVLGVDGTGSDGEIIAGLVWAVDHGADVVLMSFSSPSYSPALQAALDYAWQHDVVLVAATGNDGVTTVTYPAGDRGVMGVSNTDETDALNSSSNHGTDTFLGAPGTSITTTSPGGGYASISGTSAAAAMVAGAAALVRAFDPAATNGQVVYRLAISADDVAPVDAIGNGRLNLAGAVASSTTDFVQPSGAGVLGDGGPIVEPYVAGATCTSTGTGNWNVNGTWTCGHPPLSTDDVVIASGDVVTIPASYAAVAQSVVISAAGSSQSIVWAASTSSLVVGGNVTVNQPTNGNNAQLIVDAGTLSMTGSLSLTHSATNSNRCVRLRLTTGTVTVSGDVNVNNLGTSNGCGSNGGFGAPGAMAQIDMAGGAGTLNIAGALSVANPANVTAGMTSNAASVVNFNGSVASQTIPMPTSTTWTYGTIRMNNAHASGAVLGAAAPSTKVIGDLRVQAGLFDNGGFAISLANGQTFEVVSGATFKLSGTSGMVTAGSGSITKTFGSTSTVDYAGSTQSVSGESYGHLIVSAAGTKTLAASGSVAGNLSVNAGTLDLSSFTLNRTAAGGTITVAAAATLDIGGTNGFPTNYTTHTLSSTSIVEYSGTTQSVAVESYGHLTISGSGTKTLAGSTTVAGNLSVNGSTFDLGSNTANRTSAGGTLAVASGGALKIGGTNGFPSNYTTVTLNAAGTVEYAGSNQTVAAQTYGHLTLSGSGTKTAANSFSINGDWTNSSVAFAPGSFTVSFTGSGAQALSGNTTFNNVTVNKSNTLTLAGNQTVAGNFTITAGTVDGGSASIALTGNWSNSGTFTGSSSTVTFTGAGTQTVGGTTTFNAVTVNRSGGTLTLNASVTVAGTLTFSTGVLTTGANTLTASGTVSGAGISSGHVNGNLQRPVATSPVSFDIGGSSIGSYTPITFTGLSGSGSLTASTTGTAPASIASSAIDSTKKANRTWTLTSSGTVSGAYTVDVTYLASDLDAGASQSTFVVNRLSGGTWTTGTSASNTGNTTTTAGFTAATFGDFAVGTEKVASKVAFSTQPSDSLINVAITPAVVVEVRTSTDIRTLYSTASVAMAIGTNPGSSTLSGTTPVAAVAGRATFGDLSLNNAGTGYTLSASSSGLTGATSATFDVVSSPGSCTSTGSTAWSSTSTWTCARVPKFTDAVTIAAGHAVTIATGVSAKAYSVTINAAGGSQSLALTASDASLTVITSVTLNQPTGGTHNTQLIVDSGTVTIGGDLAQINNNTNNGRCTRTRITTGTLTIAGDLSLQNATTGTANSCGSQGGFGTPAVIMGIDMSGGAGTLNLAGALTVGTPSTITVGLSSASTSIVNFNGASAQTITVPSSTNWIYGNIEIRTTAGVATLGAAITATNMTNDLTVYAGTTFDNGGFAIAGGSGDTFTVQDSATFRLSGTSAFATGFSTITLGGGSNSSTVIYSGGAQNVAATATIGSNYDNLTLSGTAVTKTLLGAITADALLTVNSSATFAVSGFAVTVGSLTGNGTIAFGSGGANTLTVGSDNTSTTFSGVFNSTSDTSDTILKSGAGTLTLSGASTYAGKTQIAAGTLSIAADNNLGAAPVSATAGHLTFSGGTLATTATFTLNANRGIAFSSTGVIDVASSTTLTYNGIAAGAGGLTKTSTGTLTLGGANTFSGATTISAGTLSIAADSRLGTAPGSPTAGHITFNGGTLATTASFTLNANRGMAFSSTGTLDVASSTTLTYSGIAAGAGGLTKSNSGTLVVGGTNTFSGSTTISAGTLSISADANLGTAPGSPTAGKVVFNGGTLATTASFTLNSNRGLSFSSTATVNIAVSTTLVYNGIAAGASGLTKTGTGQLTLGGANTFSGGTTISAGIVSIAADSGLGTAPGSPTAGHITFGGGTLGTTASFTLSANRGIAFSSTGTIDVATATTLTYNGIAAGANGLTKTSSGTLVLGGNNTYSGTTTITAGTLVVNGSQSGSAVSINGGTLGGSGTTGAITSTVSGGTLNPGNGGPAILNGGNLNLSASGTRTVAVELNGTTAGSGHDQVNITGTVNLTGATLSGTVGFSPVGGNAFTIISNDGADAVTGTFSGLAEGADVSLSGYTFGISYVGGTGNDVVLTKRAALSGNIFEDLNYGGGAGRTKAASSGSGRSGARVELYTSAGVYSTFTTTDGSGNYTFAAVAPGTYYIRVVNTSVTSSRTGYTSSALAVQTYRTDASSGAAVSVTDYVGGTNPSVVDPGDGSAGATFNTTTYVYTAVLSGTAQSVTKVVASTTDITGLDFGFNFDTIVNVNDSGQGSLRAFITNANLLANAGLAQSGRTAAIDNAIFMISNGTAAAGLRAANNYFSGGIATISPTSALPTITDPIILDAQTQPGWTTTPIVQLSGTSAGAGAKGLYITAGSSTVRGWIINAFTGNSNSAAIWIATSGSNVIQGNYLGTNAAGSAASANYQGVYIITASNTIGGTTATTRNVISGNTWRGIFLDGGASGNGVRGNYIGLDATGTSAVANNIGVTIWSSPSNTIGGTGIGDGNVISGNTQIGIYFVFSGSSSNTVQGNIIGLNAAGTAAVANGSQGVEICCSGNAGSSNTIGGTANGAANVISGNGGVGVRVSGGTGNAILTNAIYGNGGIGIDLGSDGVTANNGTKNGALPNSEMDFPVFTSAVLEGTTLYVTGYVGSVPSQSLFASSRVEIFKADTDGGGNGEGRTYLGYVTADASGNVSGTITGVSGLALGDSITATATDGSNSTSEFGVNFVVAATAYVSASTWGTSASASRYIGVGFPAYLPTGATVFGATFNHSYRSYQASGTTCYYIEVYAGASLIGTHGSAGSPISCQSGSSYQADQVSLPEVNTVARANTLSIRLIVWNSAGARSEHNLAKISVDYQLN